jgi:hypothetical protein
MEIDKFQPFVLDLYTQLGQVQRDIGSLTAGQQAMAEQLRQQETQMRESESRIIHAMDQFEARLTAKVDKVESDLSVRIQSTEDKLSVMKDRVKRVFWATGGGGCWAWRSAGGRFLPAVSLLERDAPRAQNEARQGQARQYRLLRVKSRPFMAMTAPGRLAGCPSPERRATGDGRMRPESPYLRCPMSSDTNLSNPPKVGFVSLGCPKALVDSEQIITQLRAEGYSISGTYDGADLVVVNTCGFIDEAVQESLDAIGEALTENGKVIVTGCLGARRMPPARHRECGAPEGAGCDRPARAGRGDAGGAHAPAEAA